MIVKINTCNNNATAAGGVGRARRARPRQCAGEKLLGLENPLLQLYRIIDKVSFMQ